MHVNGDQDIQRWRRTMDRMEAQVQRAKFTALIFPTLNLSGTIFRCWRIQRGWCLKPFSPENNIPIVIFDTDRQPVVIGQCLAQARLNVIGGVGIDYDVFDQVLFVFQRDSIQFQEVAFGRN